ncbi:MAG TPA: hypothetical protein PK747_01885 [Acidobacteriota bacterium]|nr:hypothetical protein [Acidobacteriota bacterium]HQQ46143.1 hypothetical protein [Acidobacteriota bacterium]
MNANLREYLRLVVSIISMSFCFIVGFLVCSAISDAITDSVAFTGGKKVLYLLLVWLLPTISFALFTFFYGKIYSFAIPKGIFLSYGCILTVINLLILAFLITDLWDIGNKIPFSLSVIAGIFGVILFPGFLVLAFAGGSVGRNSLLGLLLLSFLITFLFWVFYGYLIAKWIKKRKGRKADEIYKKGSSHES